MEKEDADVLRKVRRLMALLRSSIDPNVPASLIQAYLDVGLKDGQSLTEIADRGNVNISTASRHLLDLGERNRRKEPGHGLVIREIDAEELRKNSYSLSPRGKLLREQIISIFKD